MNIECTNTINSQALLAIFVGPDTIKQVLGQSPFHSDFTKWVEQTKFKATEGSLKQFPAIALNDPGSVTTVLLVGLGKDNNERVAAGKVGFFAKDNGFTAVTFFNPDCGETVVRNVLLGNYRYDRYKSNQKDSLQHILLNCADATECTSASIAKGQAMAEARNFARMLVDSPAADVYPESLADEAMDLAGDNIQVEVWGLEKLEEEGMVGILGVGQGSVNPARFIHLHYKPEGTARKKIVLVGKGVTFDAGGLSLKPSAGMQTMRCDMAGSAVVMGVFHALKSLQPDVEVHGLIGAVENMCAANSYKLGDILSYSNGKNVEIHNTDAEGRLVMADCLIYGDKLGADYMVDFATLTGACVIALGEHYSALFTNEDELAEQLKKAASDSSERLWQLPLPDLYKSQLKATWGDIKNVGGRPAGSITAALFLSEFVEHTKWAHVDIAGPAFLSKPFEHFNTGGTGVMVETTLSWLQS